VPVTACHVLYVDGGAAGANGDAVVACKSRVSGQGSGRVVDSCVR
jgi:hypothetical protein